MMDVNVLHVQVHFNYPNLLTIVVQLFLIAVNIKINVLANHVKVAT